MRENMIGRANVVDTPELQEYYRQLAQHEAGALWTVANKIEPWFPKSSSQATLWRYRDLRELVLRSVDLGDAGAGRPARRDADQSGAARRQR